MIKKKLLLVPLLCLLAMLARAQDNYQVTPKGAAYRIFTHNSGDKIKLNDVVTFNVIQKTDKDSVLFSSYAQGRPIKLQVQAPANVGDLMEVMPHLASKDSAEVRVPADSVFKGHEDQRPVFIKKGSNLIFTIKIERIQSLDDAIAERNAALATQKAADDARKAEAGKLQTAEAVIAAKYIAHNKLVLKTTPSGLKYMITKPSLKRNPLPGDTLLVNYTGYTLDGKVFDSSIESDAKKAALDQPGRHYEPYKLKAGEASVIQGWVEGLLLMPEGSKAKFIIPSKLGYGAEGQGPIPPFATLVFDLELVKVIRVKHLPVKQTVRKTTARKHTAIKK